MRADEVLIFTRGQPAIHAQQLQYHAQKFFKDRAAIQPPKVSDRIITALPSEDGRKKEEAASQAQQSDNEAEVVGNTDKNGRAHEANGAATVRVHTGGQPKRFLKFATDEGRQQRRGVER